MKTATQTPDLPVNDGLVSIAFAMKFLNVGRSTIYALIKGGKLPYVKIGSRTLIPMAALRRLATPDEPAIGAA